MPVTLRFQSTGAVPGSGAPVTMRGGNITIGRGPENDLVLPDPDRMISKQHCVIEDHNGNVVVIDLSTNGTFLNYGKIPLGNTPTPLNDGDVLSMGPYELVVDFGQTAVSAEDSLLAPVGEGPISHGDARRADTGDVLDALTGGGPDFLDDLLGDGKAPRGHKQLKTEDPDDLLPPLGDDDILGPAPVEPEVRGASFGQHSPSANDAIRSRAVIPDDWDDDFLAPTPPKPRVNPFDEPEDKPPPRAAETAPPPAAPRPAPPPSDTETVAPRPPVPMPGTAPAAPPVATPVAAPAAGTAAEDAAARAFLDSAGAAEVAVPADQLVATMTRLGDVFRIMIEGLREVLMTRTSIKSEFRINQTMISAHGNNPLKFSISPEQAIEAIVKPPRKGYLEAPQAAREALDDIKAHEVAMVTGMEAALRGVLARLDPKALEGKIETSGGFGSLLKGKKARYWEVYEKMYGEIRDQAENDFQELFAKEFARAYQDQLERLK